MVTGYAAESGAVPPAPTLQRAANRLCPRGFLLDDHLREVGKLAVEVGLRMAAHGSHNGFRSTLAWLQLKALGYKDVPVYNGGWADWDRTLTLPIVKGNKSFDADFDL